MSTRTWLYWAAHIGVKLLVKQAEVELACCDESWAEFVRFGHIIYPSHTILFHRTERDIYRRHNI